MINPFTEIDWRPDEAGMFSFGRTVGVGFSVMAAAFFLIGLRRAPVSEAALTPLWLLAVGGAVFFLCVAAPKWAFPLYLAWFSVAACVGFVVSNVLLALFYYAFFTPFAIVLRIITGRDPLRLKKPKNAASYWVKRDSRGDVKRYFKQY